MDEIRKAKLLSLYTQKGSLVTEIELAQQRLQRVNQQIQQLANSEAEEQSKPKGEENPSEENPT